jgi:hypothetical protein
MLNTPYHTSIFPKQKINARVYWEVRSELLRASAHMHHGVYSINKLHIHTRARSQARAYERAAHVHLWIDSLIQRSSPNINN